VSTLPLLRHAILDSLVPSTRCLPKTATLLALAITATAPAKAQDAAEQTLPTIKAQDDGDTAPAVTQVGKTPQLLRDVPQTITVISRETLDAQGATSLADALRNVPGITLSAGEGGVIGDNVNLRGFSARTDLYVDGMRDRGQYSRETAFLESVEVLKGPSSMLFGRGSTGGVINQITKQPRRTEASDVSASIGTNAYYRFTADTNQPFGESAAFRIAAFGHSNESTRDVIESERYGIAPSLRFGIGKPTEIMLSAVIQRRDDIPDYGFPIVNGKPLQTDRDNFYGFTDDGFEQHVDQATARITHEFSSALTLRNQTQFSSVRTHAKPTRISATTRALDRAEREIEDQSIFNQTDLIAHIGSGAVRHTVIAGIEVGRDNYQNQTYTTTGEETPLPSFENPVYGPIPTNIVRTKNVYTDNVGDTLAAYANEQLDLGDQWKVIVGLRWDRFEFDSNSTNNAGVATVIPTKTDTMLSQRAGVVYQPTQVQTYYVSYGTSFNPSAETLTINTANQNVDPEENRSFEIGGKWSFAEGQLLVTSAVFRVDKTNARTNDPLLGVTVDGEIRVQGFEFGVSGPITEQWKVMAGYTYLDGEIIRLTESSTTNNVTTYSIRDGNTLPNTPKHNASLWTTYDFQFGEAGVLQLGGGLVYATDRILNNANTASTDGYTRFDATIAYVATRYTVRLNLLNATNAEYFDVASAGRATPVQRRAALATFSWKF
jgi:catecholate siderophore receptor